jgi:hypothetical protein
MRVAIVHYWLLGMRGGERVVEALCRLAPDADIFTLFYDPEKVSPFPARAAEDVVPQSDEWLPVATAAGADRTGISICGYDLVISSESGPAKGVTCLDHAARKHCHAHALLWDLYPIIWHEWTRSRLRRALGVNYLRVGFRNRGVDDPWRTATMSGGAFSKRTGATRRWCIRRWPFRISATNRRRITT